MAHPDRLPRVRHLLRSVCVLALGLLVACGDDKPSPAGSSSTGAGSGGTGGVPVPPDPYPMSAKATVKLKTGPRLLADLAQILELDEGSLCTEIGDKPCGDVHSIALG